MCNYQGATTDGDYVLYAHMYEVSVYGVISFIWQNMLGYTLTNPLLTATVATYLSNVPLKFFPFL